MMYFAGDQLVVPLPQVGGGGGRAEKKKKSKEKKNNMEFLI